MGAVCSRLRGLRRQGSGGREGAFGARKPGPNVFFSKQVSLRSPRLALWASAPPRRRGREPPPAAQRRGGAAGGVLSPARARRAPPSGGRGARRRGPEGRASHRGRASRPPPLRASYLVRSVGPWPMGAVCSRLRSLRRGSAGEGGRLRGAEAWTKRVLPGAKTALPVATRTVARTPTRQGPSQ